MNTVVVRAAEETYLGLIIMSVFWAIFSGACVVVTVQARERIASWVWGSSLLIASLVAAYCFGRLL